MSKKYIMNVRLLQNSDKRALEEFLAPHKTKSMFICSNLKSAGIDYKGSDFEGEYFGCFDSNNKLQGVIVHYWNGNLMMHAENKTILKELIFHIKNNITRPIAGVLGPNMQTEHVIKKLRLSKFSFSINSNEGLYEINLEDLNPPFMSADMNIAPTQSLPVIMLLEWMKNYEIEALGALVNDDLIDRVQKKVDRILRGDSWVLFKENVPVSIVAFNARLEDMVQVGPVWTPIEYRNKGFARMLLAYSLNQEKLKGTKKAILFTDNPAAIKAYNAIGFKKIGNYRLALLQKPVKL